MRELRYKVGALSSVIIPLGIQGETGATTIRIDFSEWTADGTDGYPTISVLTPNGVQYTAATNREDEISEDGSSSVVVWPITNVDTSEFGDGLITVSLYSEGGVLMKSVDARTSLAPSFMSGSSEDAPDQFDYWLEQLNEKAAEVGAANISAAASAESAEESENNTSSYLEAVRALYTLIQAEHDPPAYIEGLMALSYPANVSLAVSDWEEDDGEYVAYVSVPLVLTTTITVFLPDETAGNMASGIFVGPSEDGVVRFRTATIPTGTVSGTLLVLGHMNAGE